VVSKLDEKELEFSQNALKNYANLKETIWRGDQYRLVNPFENQMASIQFVSKNKDQAVVFNYLTENRYDLISLVKGIKLSGLDAKKKYKIKEINLYPNTKSTINAEQIYSGEYLMTIGINPDISNRRTSVVLEVNEVR
jgi:alpha-galactosidase